ncbi:uncharacterized protein N7479_009817 [Penicillium vulpinum]|uniref:Bulb-type lectin domain-containing protein n=1 Tax=Penicillium vulpinum TaxID=29845 RepID=A0A1V6RYL8_9EURO|nr:uncharacterized protein N7479_009817 [Penicillium vulpinum]KAJ5951404.1 hypothetical protein N7479_009817 [Penicillium vulpinum]OQE06706.1 hypothetical protein PENVUL_c017G07757 [Penicillium vulpinum]
MVRLALTIFLLPCYTLAAPPADFPGDETPYRVTPTGTVSPDYFFGTFLYKYLDCNKNFGPGAKDKIDEAYHDAWLISNTAGVASGINWNSAAAMEFLGPSGLNQAQQPQIQAVFANTATVINGHKSPFQHFIKIRCDDPEKLCQNQPDQDPYQPNPLNSGDPPKPTPLSYSRNSDPDNPDTPMINFCGGFFARRSLADAITYGMALASPDNFNLANYDNRAQAFLHGLYHLDLAANSPDPNPRVYDLRIDIKLGAHGRIYTTDVYGPFNCKVLARWLGRDPGSHFVGYYIQRNSDSLVYYAFAKYLMSKNGNVYPHLPIVTPGIAGPFYPPYRPDSLAVFVTEGSNFYLNTTDDLTIWDSSPGGNYPSCSSDKNGSESSSPLTIDGFAPASAYPDDYNSQVSTWIEALRSTDGNSNLGWGGDAGQQIAMAS